MAARAETGTAQLMSVPKGHEVAGRDDGAPGWECDRESKGGCGVLECPTFGGCDTPSLGSGKMPELAAPVALSTKVGAPSSGLPKTFWEPRLNWAVGAGIAVGAPACLGRGDTSSAGSAGPVAALCSPLPQQHHGSSLPWGPWGAELPEPPLFPKSSFSVHTAQCKGLQLPPVAAGCSSTAWGAVAHGGTLQPQPPTAWGCCSWISPAPDWELWVAGVTAARPNSPCPALPDRPVVILVVLGAAVAQLAPL